jgi:hypothetical protein
LGLVTLPPLSLPVLVAPPPELVLLAIGLARTS